MVEQQTVTDKKANDRTENHAEIHADALTPVPRVRNTLKKRSVIRYGQGTGEVRIYTLRRRQGLESFQCCWYELGKRSAKTFGRMEDARAFAHQKSVGLGNEQPINAPVKFAEIEIFRACEARALQYGTTAVAAIEEWSGARAALAGRSIGEAVSFFLQHGRDVQKRTVNQAITELLAAKKLQGIGDLHAKRLGINLGRFGKAVGSRIIAEIAPSDIDGFLASIKGTTVRHNTRKHIKILFRWARDRSYVPDKKTAAECSQRIELPQRPPGILTPDELQRLLTVCSPKLLPFIVLGAFAGIRSAEILRLNWENILWDRGYIEITAHQAKTRSRRLVPILPNLHSWLQPWKNASGPVCTLSMHGRAIQRATKAADFKWKQNALRHSFASYRLAIVKDAARVSLEMGNSPAIVFRHYRELVTEDSAAAWFAIARPGE